MTRAVVPVALLLVACGGRPPAGPGDDAVDLGGPIVPATVSGDSQIGRSDRLLDESLVFRVTDPGGRPVNVARATVRGTHTIDFTAFAFPSGAHGRTAERRLTTPSTSDLESAERD